MLILFFFFVPLIYFSPSFSSFFPTYIVLPSFPPIFLYLAFTFLTIFSPFFYFPLSFSFISDVFLCFPPTSFFSYFSLLLLYTFLLHQSLSCINFYRIFLSIFVLSFLTFLPSHLLHLISAFFPPSFLPNVSYRLIFHLHSTPSYFTTFSVPSALFIYKYSYSLFSSPTYPCLPHHIFSFHLNTSLTFHTVPFSPTHPISYLPLFPPFIFLLAP